MEIIELECTKENIERLTNYLNNIKDIFPIPLDKKIKIQEYSKKVLENGIVYFASENLNDIGCIIGYANDMTNKISYISVIGVNKEYQRKGIGELLIKEFIKKAQNENMKEIRLFVHKDNNSAIKFYEKNGFIIDNNEKANADYNITLKREIENFNMLITSVGRRGYLVEYFKEALKGIGKVFVANSSNITPAFKYADESVVTPLIYDDTYIDFIIKYCKEKNIKMVISLFDIDLPVLAKNKERFENENIKLIVSNKEFVEICNDKWKTYKFLKDNNLNAPKTYIDLNQVLDGIKEHNISYPIIVKPRWGMGSISVLEAENEEELRVFYEKTKRNIFDSYLQYESKEDIENCVLLQEKLKGQEYGLDVINDLDANYVNTIVKEKFAMRSGETDCAKTVKNDELKKLGEYVSKLSNHIANLDMDVFLVNNKPYILEMNARFGGGYPFSHMAGVNEPKAIIKWARNEKVESSMLEERNNVLSHKDIRIIEL